MLEQPTVFIVDDDPHAAQSVAALMAAIGLPTEIFPSSEAFLERFSDSAKNDALNRGCLVLDIRLPGISGPELHKTLTRRGFQIPTVLVSGHFDAEQKSLPNHLACLEKPYPGTDLTDWVKTALGL